MTLAAKPLGGGLRRRGDASAIRVLKAAGADENKQNASGVSPRSLAESIANDDVASVL